MKFCPYCGADLLKEDAAFCAECGKKLSVAEEAPSPAHEADSQHNAKPSKQKTPKKDSRKRKKSKQKKVQEPPLPEIEGNLQRMDTTAITTISCLRIWIGKKKAPIRS